MMKKLLLCLLLACGPAFAQPVIDSNTKTEVLSKQARAPGTYVVSEILLKPEQKRIAIIVDRTSLLVSDSAKVTTEISLDEGKTWELLVGFTFTGALPPKLPAGSDGTESSAAINIPQVGKANRVIRVSIQHSMPMQTAIKVFAIE